MKFWNVQGWLYDALFVLVPHRQLVQEVGESLSSDKFVLDAGCGSARLSTWSKADVVGLDFSPSVLRYARKRAGRLVQADLCGGAPFKDGVFDAAVSLNVLYALPDPDSALEEVRRVLKPGGQLILATPVDERLLPLVVEHIRKAKVRDWLRTVVNLPRLVAWIINLAIRGVFEQSTFHFFTEEELRCLVESHGFTIVSDEPCYAGLDRLIVAERR